MNSRSSRRINKYRNVNHRVRRPKSIFENKNENRQAMTWKSQDMKGSRAQITDDAV